MFIIKKVNPVYFPDPSGKNKEYFSKVLRKCHESIVENISNTSKREPFPDISPAEMESFFKKEKLPKKGKDLIEVIKEFEEKILPYNVNFRHPKYIGHMVSQPTLSSIVAENYISATNQSLTAWEIAPVGTFVEELVGRWLCEICGYKKDEGYSIITSGATASIEEALYLALNWFVNKKFNKNFREKGLFCDERISKLRVYTTKQSHYSIAKVCSVLGLGKDRVRMIKTDENFKMRVDKLKEKIESDKKEGLIPFCVIAIAGTTNTGNIDPILEISKIAKENGMWFHVDAAYGGSFKLSNKVKHLFKGMSQADSISLDPQKGLYQSLSLGALVLKDKSNYAYLQVNADYLMPENDDFEILVEDQVQDGIVNIGELTIQGSKRFDSLKLWFAFKNLGTLGFSQVLDRQIELTEYLEKSLRKSGNFIILHEMQLNILCFLFIPPILRIDSKIIAEESKGYVNKLLYEINEKIKRKLQSSGIGFIATTQLYGQKCLRANLLNVFTTKKDIQEIVKKIEEIGLDIYENEIKNNRYIKINFKRLGVLRE